MQKNMYISLDKLDNTIVGDYSFASILNSFMIYKKLVASAQKTGTDLVSTHKTGTDLVFCT